MIKSTQDLIEGFYLSSPDENHRIHEGEYFILHVVPLPAINFFQVTLLANDFEVLDEPNVYVWPARYCEQMFTSGTMEKLN